MEALILIFGATGLIVATVAISVLLNGWALNLLWTWFVVPTYPALPTLALGQAIGLSMVASFLTYQYIDTEPKKSEGKFLEMILNVVLRPVMAVLFGLIIRNIFF